MTDKIDAYRANAEMCEHMAITVDRGNRAEWLGLAGSWLSLLHIEEQLKLPPAGQSDSELQH
jgi:hypothetical protein